jgi:hypothetical protein
MRTVIGITVRVHVAQTKEVEQERKLTTAHGKA